MALEHPHLLAVSLAVALIGTACSAPIEASGKVSEDLVNGEDVGAGRSPIRAEEPVNQPTPLVQEQLQKPQTVAEQRATALAEHWLGNARKLHASGDLQAAKLELLKANEVAPNNQAVATELAALQAALGEPVGFKPVPERTTRMPAIAEQRARAIVQWELESAQTCMAGKDYTGAIDRLRGAALQIKAKNDIDWGDLPAQVKAATEKAERRRDGQ